MAKCIIVSGTRVCDGGAVYRVNGGKTGKRYPKRAKMRQRQLQPIAEAIRALDANPAQKKLAVDLLDIVLHESWTSDKTANCKDIEESVRLLLVKEIGKLKGSFTLVGY